MSERDEDLLFEERRGLEINEIFLLDLEELQEAAKAAGVCFYELPKNLKPDQIDPLIRNAVMQINQSGWCFTAESCQGHPDMVEEAPWASNTDPMLRLICQKKDTGRMMATLVEAMYYQKGGEDGWQETLGFQGYPRAIRSSDWTEVLVYIRCKTAFDRNLGIQAYERFARLVNRVEAR